MKKTLISIVLIVSLLSTALFSVVFAGYSDSKTATAHAVVSAFNVVIATDVDNDLKLTPLTTNAPLASITITGTPDVAVDITYAEVDLQFGTWANGYCPIEFKVGNITYGLYGTASETYKKSDNIAALETAVENAIKTATTITAQAGQSLNGLYDRVVTVSWNSQSEAQDNSLTSDATIDLTFKATVQQATT